LLQFDLVSERSAERRTAENARSKSFYIIFINSIQSDDEIINRKLKSFYYL